MQKKTERESILEKNLELMYDKQEQQNIKNVMLFLSFDITNSTSLKLQYPLEWSKIIKILISQKFGFMNFWKFNGDEMLYKQKIGSVDFICRIIEQAYKYLFTLQSQMKKYVSEISIKATIWIALTESEIKEYKHNFTFSYDGITDFVGKNIDEGFRLTKRSSIQKIAIDPKIIYILLDTNNIINSSVKEDNTQIDKNDLRYQNLLEIMDIKQNESVQRLKKLLYNIHLIGYSKCKGVWGNKPYPIYWYFDNSLHEIEYDEYLDNHHLWGEKVNSIGEDKNAFSNISSIYTQVKNKEELTDILLSLTFNKENDVEILSEGRANFYYMVACINPQSRKVLIAKRSTSRKHLKGVWDFGNVKYQTVKMKEIIEREYKNTFGIKINLIVDHDRGDNIKPFGYCTIYRNCRPHNSILCYAIIENYDNLTDPELIQYITQNMTNSYEEVRFVDSKDVESFSSLTLDEIRIDSEKAESNANESFESNKCIMYFKNSIEGAMNEYKRIKEQE